MKQIQNILFICSIILFVSCSESGNANELLLENVGVHKIVLNIQGDKEVEYVASFGGSSVDGTNNLYDAENNTKETPLVVVGNAYDNQNYICKTDSKGTFITCSFVVSSIYEGKTVNLSLKAYIDDKLVKTLEKSINFDSNIVVQTFSIATQDIEN